MKVSILISKLDHSTENRETLTILAFPLPLLEDGPTGS